MMAHYHRHGTIMLPPPGRCTRASKLARSRMSVLRWLASAGVHGRSKTWERGRCFHARRCPAPAACLAAYQSARGHSPDAASAGILAGIFTAPHSPRPSLLPSPHSSASRSPPSSTPLLVFVGPFKLATRTAAAAASKCFSVGFHVLYWRGVFFH
jgi:hypothetical protein